MGAGAKSEQVILLILPKAKEVYPLSTAALKCAQGSQRRLDRHYQGAMVLDRNGALRRIDRIESLGLWGNSLGQRILSFISRTKHVVVHFSEPLSFQIQDLKQMLIDCVEASYELGFDEVDDNFIKQKTIARISSAQSVEDVFDSLPMPCPEDSLDVL